MADLYGVLTTLPGDQRAVRFERDYAVGVDDLWSALTEPERLARWLDPVSGELAVGGRVTVHFDDGDAAFEVVDCAAPHRLVVRWLHAERSSEVAVDVTETAAGARLVLVHALLPASSAPGYAAGWHWHLDALGAVLRGADPGEWAEAFDALYAEYQRAADATMEA